MSVKIRVQVIARSAQGISVVKKEYVTELEVETDLDSQVAMKLHEENQVIAESFKRINAGK
jgi:hypothetical protein